MAGGCGLPTALHAVQRANIQLGDSVVVQVRKQITNNKKKDRGKKD